MKVGKPGAANNRLKYLSSDVWLELRCVAGAIGQKRFKLGHDPGRVVKKIEYASDGYHTWTVEEVIKFVERHRLGTQASRSR